MSITQVFFMACGSRPPPLSMNYDLIIIGAGPGGLACATRAAAAGLKTLVLEKKTQVGAKVCAGGITWNGLIRTVPAEIAERSFPEQHLYTPLQRATLRSSQPIIATVNRQVLGRRMAEQAVAAGAELRLGCRLCALDGQAITCQGAGGGRQERLLASYIVGADGSSSLVRRSLGLATEAVGVGITYQVPGDFPRMEWHLHPGRFASGYAWVFPQRSSASIGAYVDRRAMSAIELKGNFLCWAKGRGIALGGVGGKAELINFDYRGYRFGNTFLVGDAAGLASGLTGEGIYSAIVSGEAVADIIVSRNGAAERLARLARNHHRHRRMLDLLNRSRRLAAVIGEAATLALRSGAIAFSAIEMAQGLDPSSRQ